MSSELHQVCTLLDKLTLDALLLIEEQVQTKINLENAMRDGELHLARSRYVLGQNSVSALQLPTENDEDYRALARVVEGAAEESADGVQLKSVELNKTDGLSDPIKLFGCLVPQNLHQAQSSFKHALQWVVQAANVQNRLIKTCTGIQQLKTCKNEIQNQQVESLKV